MIDFIIFVLIAFYKQHWAIKFNTEFHKHNNNSKKTSPDINYTLVSSKPFSNPIYKN